MNIKRPLIFAAFLVLSGCNDEAWETVERRYDFGNGTYSCTCEENSTYKELISPGYEQSGSSESYTEEGKKCVELGYTFDYQSGDNTYYKGPNDGAQPGANGYFATGGGAKPAYCNGSYQSPTSDVQLNSLCETAFIYRCAGNKTAADFTCTQYKNISQSGTPINCPYCD